MCVPQKSTGLCCYPGCSHNSQSSQRISPLNSGISCVIKRIVAECKRATECNPSPEYETRQNGSSSTPERLPFAFSRQPFWLPISELKMASGHQVTCIVPDASDADRRIDSIGGATGAEGNNGPWALTIDTAIAGMKSGKWSFWTIADGRKVNVIIATRNGREYLKTEADGAEPNNLLALPRCR